MTTMSQNSNQKINRARKDLYELVKKGKRKLFELETLESLQEIKNGQGERYKSAAEVMRDIRSDRGTRN